MQILLNAKTEFRTMSSHLEMIGNGDDLKAGELVPYPYLYPRQRLHGCVLVNLSCICQLWCLSLSLSLTAAAAAAALFCCLSIDPHATERKTTGRAVIPAQGMTQTLSIRV